MVTVIGAPGGQIGRPVQAPLLASLWHSGEMKAVAGSKAISPRLVSLW